MALSPEANRYRFFYPAIQGAVAERASTADVFAAVRSAVASQGGVTPPGLFRAVNELRGAAVAERNYAALVGRRGLDMPVLGIQVPTAIFARDPDVRAMNPLLQVDYQVQVRDQEGNVTPKWLTSFGIPFVNGLTTGDLISQVAMDAEVSAAGYGGTLAGDPVLGAILAY